MVIIVSVGVYAVLAFPRDAIAFSVSFTVGADREEKILRMPILHDKAQIQIDIDSGSALWQVRILDSNENRIWEHTQAQGEQTSYTSDWIDLPSEQYSFVLGTVGIGDLQASIKVTTKGGFW